MNKIQNMNLKEILDIIDTLIITQEDCEYIFKDEEVQDKFRELYDMYIKGTYQVEILENFLKDNEDFIDKENLILILAKNCKYQLIAIDEEFKEAEQKEPITEQEKNMKVAIIHEVNTRKKMVNNTQRVIYEKGKGIDKILTFYRYDDKENRFILDVLDSRELIDKKHISSVRNRKRFEKIESSFGEEDEEIGIGYILQVISFSDLKEIFPNEKFAFNIQRDMYDREIINKTGISAKELNILMNEDTEEYGKLLEYARNEDFVPYMKQVLKENLKYVDFDKLLLIAGHRFEYGLEMLAKENQDTKGYNEIIGVIKDNIEDKHANISCNLEYEYQDKPVLKQVEYSVEDLNKFYNRFVDNEYLSKSKIQDYKDKISDNEITLKDISENYISVIYTDSALESIAKLNDINFLLVVNKLKWNREKIFENVKQLNNCSTELIKELLDKNLLDTNNIIGLYMDKIIDIEKLLLLKDKINLDNINLQELTKYYKNNVREDATNKDKEDFKTYLKLYKTINIDEATKEEKEKKSEEIIELMMKENKNDDKNVYLEYIENCYKDGLLTLNIILNWAPTLLNLSPEQLVDKFCNDDILSLEQLKELEKNKEIPIDCIFNRYKQIVFDPNIDYNQRINYLKTGYVSEEVIFEMYEKNMVFEEDLQQLAYNGIVRKDKLNKIINNRNWEELERFSEIKSLEFDNLTKRKINNESDNIKNNIRYNENDNKIKNKLIIDPEKRLELIKLFKVSKINPNLSEDNPFYNYEFYATKNEEGKIDFDSILILERYYEDKDNEEKFATNNATYFLRAKDWLVVENLKKDEMTKERKNIVFTANHILASEDKNGSWASSVIYSVVKTMLSSDLKDMSKDEKRRVVVDRLNEVYSEEEILEILNLASEIDSGEHTYEIVDPNKKIIRQRKKIKEDERNNDAEIR